MGESKHCKGPCGRTLPLEEFGTQRGRVKPRCRACYAAEERARVAEKRKTATTDPALHDYGNKPLPPGYLLKGVSQFVDAEGNVKSQWIKSDREKGKQVAEWIEALRELCEPYRGWIEPTPAPTQLLSAELLNVIPIGDLHVGLHCWGEEVGENFDLKIAERNTCAAFDGILAAAPDAKRALILNVGDYFHQDGNGTTTKGTPVDSDARWPKIVRVGLRIFRYAIRKTLETHETVHVVCAIGNHDARASVMLAQSIALMFESESRVTVEESPAKFHYYKHGKVLIGTTHGDTGKASDLPIVMADEMPQAWADSLFRHWYCGHIHHDKVKEFRGATVENVRVLGPADAWHRAQGYRSGRDLKCDTWHNEYGHVQRNVIGIRRIVEMVEER